MVIKVIPLTTLLRWDFYDNGRKKSWGPNGADDAALWLWRAHNAASVTRALQADSLTFHLWPSPELCPTCSEASITRSSLAEPVLLFVPLTSSLSLFSGHFRLWNTKMERG